MLQVPIRAKQKPKDKLHTFLFLEGRIRTQLQSYQRKPQIKQLLEAHYPTLCTQPRSSGLQRAEVTPHLCNLQPPPLVLWAQISSAPLQPLSLVDVPWSWHLQYPGHSTANETSPFSGWFQAFLMRPQPCHLVPSFSLSPWSIRPWGLHFPQACTFTHGLCWPLLEPSLCLSLWHHQSCSIHTTNNNTTWETLLH